MNKYTPDQYNKILYSLPQEIRNVVISMDTTKHLWKIGGKHNLHVDKIGDMHDLAMDVMMGIIGTKDFVKELQDTLQIGSLEASVLARDIDENIFKPIKETMTHLYAGRAPYKPSSSLVQFSEEDEDHPALDQATLLKEIEDPTPAEVKKETVVTTVGKGVSMQAGEESKLKPLPASPLSKGEGHITPNSLTTSDTYTPVASNILNQLASIKLNQAFVMPKGPEGINQLRNLEAKTVGKVVSELGGKETPNQLTNSQPNNLGPATGLQGAKAGLEAIEKKVAISQIDKKPLDKSVSVQAGEEKLNNLATTHTDTLPPKIDPYRERI